MSMDLRRGDALEAMASLGAGSVHAIVTDPPYGLAFMGKEWDHGVPGVPFWLEALRVLKPGAHLVAFGGTRTYHRLACAIEDAGFEIRDCLSWLYGSGFPKSLDVSKAIDKAAGAEREVVGASPTFRQHTRGNGTDGFRDRRIDGSLTAPATEAARTWEGWGTALKPAWEPIILARKPLVGTVAANVLEHGTGALNIDGCRVESGARPVMVRTSTVVRANAMSGESTGATASGELTTVGRWPANLVLDEEAAAMLDEQSGTLRARGNVTPTKTGPSWFTTPSGTTRIDGGDTGGASRFFFTAKASSGERHYAGKNSHPTVKPVDLMRWLVRLVTPPGGLVLNPFMGSGSTGVAALAEGFRFVGCELDAEMVDLARRRIAGPLFAEACR
jgi:site-specific DNA-methyltransferase (adenine-specific)